MVKDKFHQNVREALEKDGWNITHDPYFLMLGRRRGYIDLGAEKAIIGAEKAGHRIAVEIKSFVGKSELNDFEDALGQFLVYVPALEDKEPERELFLAVPLTFYNRFFDDPYFLRVAKRYAVQMVVFDEAANIIMQWIK